MSSQFTSFVIFAEMRTGSNFLESNINALDNVICHGEAFNPAFIGYPKRDDILGVSKTMRDSDPNVLLDKICDQDGVLGGFRYFNDHDPRILDRILADEGCAKIILTRNPLDSYVSLQIAKETNQWKLGNVKQRKEAKVHFDASEFADHLSVIQSFQVILLNRLQMTGQTAFYLAYEDLKSLEVMNGLAKWLGVNAKIEGLDKSLKPQNPASILTKVSNPQELEQGLTTLDRFNLGRTPNFEPRRGPMVRGYYTAAHSSLVFMPMSGGPKESILNWMAALDKASLADLKDGLNQKQLRDWKKNNPNFRSFTVLRHPVARAYSIFCQALLSVEDGAQGQLRKVVKQQFGAQLSGNKKGLNAADLRTDFLCFLNFLKANLSGQTSMPVSPLWASQTQTLAGFADVASPDYILREDELDQDLAYMCLKLGCEVTNFEQDQAVDDLPKLSDIYDDDIEEKCRSAYSRDYVTFGFRAWQT